MDGIRFPRILTALVIGFTIATGFQVVGLFSGTFIQSFSFRQGALLFLVAALFAWFGYQQYSSAGSDLVALSAYAAAFVTVTSFAVHLLFNVQVSGVAVAQPWNDFVGTFYFFGPREPWYRFVERGIIGGAVAFFVFAVPLRPLWARVAVWSLCGGILSGVRPDVTMLVAVYVPGRLFSTTPQWTWQVATTNGGRVILALTNTIVFVIGVFFVGERYLRSQDTSGSQHT